MRRLTAEEVRDSILAVSGDAAAQGRRAERLSADPARGPGRPVGAGPGLDDLAAATRPPGAASTSTSSGRSWCRSWRPTTRPTPTPVARCATPRPCRRRPSACSTASSPTSRPPASPTGCVGECPGDLAGQVRRAIRLTTGPRAAAEEVRRDVDFVRDPSRPRRPRRSGRAGPVRLLVLNANAFLYLD